MANYRYMVFILKYFVLNLVDPFEDFLKTNISNKLKLKKSIRIKLLIFLIKTKVVTRLVQNAARVRPDDVLNLPPDNKRRFRLESQITYVCLGDKEECAENYRKVGQSMQKFLFSLLKCNNVKVNYKDSLKFINDPEYYDKIIDAGSIEGIRSKLSTMQMKEILNAKVLFKYIGASMSADLVDFTQLHLCFPDPEFLYMFFQLINSKWTNLGMSLLSSSVKFVEKFYIPLDIFEGELVANQQFPQTRVRLLRDKGFFSGISKAFLTQRDFLSKKNLRRSMKPKYRDYFQHSLRSYSPFDRDAAKSTPVDSLTVRGNSQLDIRRAAPQNHQGAFSAKRAAIHFQRAQAAEEQHERQSRPALFQIGVGRNPERAERPLRVGRL